MKLEINLPVVLNASDYHEFNNMQDYFKKLNKSIKVKEVGCAGWYYGMAYIGNLSDKVNMKMYQKLVKKCEGFCS
jgi:branched-subunit amino acid permease